MACSAALACLVSCASIAPPRPRFIAVFEQDSGWCRIQILQDTRTGSCFVTFRCGRQPVQALAVAAEVCVP